MCYSELVCFTINEFTVIKSVLIFMHKNYCHKVAYMVANPAGMTYASFRHHRQSGVFFKILGGGQLSAHVLVIFLFIFCSSNHFQHHYFKQSDTSN